MSQTVELVCACNNPANPDKLLVGCSSESCKKWLHEECIKDQALRATFERLGTDKPHIPVKEEKKEGDDDNKADAKAEPNGDVTVKAESVTPRANGRTNGNGNRSNRALKAGSEDVPEAGAGAGEEEGNTSGLALRSRRTRTPSARAAASKSTTPAPTTSTSAAATPATSTTPAIKTESGSGTAGRKPGRPRKKSLPAPTLPSSKVTNKERPWEGLFSVTLEMNGQPYLQFTDLRADVVAKGGAKTWTEPIRCLVCGVLVN